MRTIVAILTFVFNSTVAAQPAADVTQAGVSADILDRTCNAKSGDEGFERGAAYCLGYITGISEMIAGNASYRDQLGICIPEYVKSKEAKSVVLYYMKINHSKDTAASFVVMMAFKSKWPCARK